MSLNVDNQNQRNEFAKKLKLAENEFPFEAKGIKAVELRYALDDYFLGKSDLAKMEQSKVFASMVSKPEILANLFLDRADQELVEMLADPELEESVKDMVALSQFFRQNQDNIEAMNNGQKSENKDQIVKELQGAGMRIQKAMFTLISQNPELLKLVEDFDIEKDKDKDYIKKKIRTFYFTALTTAQSILNIDQAIFDNLDTNEYNFLLDCLNLENTWGFGFFTKM